jgi:hypothetical protein
MALASVSLTVAGSKAKKLLGRLSGNDYGWSAVGDKC